MKLTKQLLFAACVLMLPALMAYSAQDPCISNPLMVTRIKWPSSTTGQKGIGWTSSATQPIASFDFTSPNLVVFTDTRGCTQTIRR